MGNFSDFDCHYWGRCWACWGNFPISLYVKKWPVSSSSLIAVSSQTGKFVFCARKIFFPVKFARLEKPPHTACPSEMAYFSSMFSNSARLIDSCAHGNTFARGRSFARTTYFPVWVSSTKEKKGTSYLCSEQNVRDTIIHHFLFL